MKNKKKVLIIGGSVLAAIILGIVIWRVYIYKEPIPDYYIFDTNEYNILYPRGWQTDTSSGDLVMTQPLFGPSDYTSVIMVNVTATNDETITEEMLQDFFRARVKEIEENVENLNISQMARLEVNGVPAHIIAYTGNIDGEPAYSRIQFCTANQNKLYIITGSTNYSAQAYDDFRAKFEYIVNNFETK